MIFDVMLLLALLGGSLILVDVGLLLALWVARAWQSWNRVGRQVPVSDEQLLDVGYSAGVVRVGQS
ncbi:hypothetical protein ACWKSP_26180 [Micromonosporaceae bacterium Da 78-11]